MEFGVCGYGKDLGRVGESELCQNILYTNIFFQKKNKIVEEAMECFRK